MSDYFSNVSNDYINPELNPCPSESDDNFLKFLPDGKVGITSGNNILSSISFADIAIPISSFSKEQKILQEGEVTFVEGLTKGLCSRRQGFWLPGLDASDNNALFMEIDLSICYYNNFKTTYANIEASSNYSENLDIEDALNEVFENSNIKVSAYYDPSALDFQGDYHGYDFEISNIVLTLIDASQNINSPFTPVIVSGQRVPIQYTLNEDPSANVVFSRYFNTAMQGIIMKGIYPTNNEIVNADKWVYIKHVSNYITLYDSSTVATSSDVSTGLTIIFDASSFIGTKLSVDVSIGQIDASIDVSTGITIDASIVDWRNIINSIVNNSTITNSNITDSSVIDTSLNNVYIEDSSVWTISGINTMLYRSVTRDSSISSGVIYNGINIDNSINISIVSGTIIYDSVLTDSSITGASVINNNSTIVSSYIQDSWTNAYVLTINPSTGQKLYVTEDDTLDIDTSSNRVKIYDSLIWDSSLNNTIIYDSSIYSSFIEDSSLIRCTVYNSIYDNVYKENTRDIMIDSSLVCDFDIINDTSTYYVKIVKKLDIGLNGNSTTTIISAGDYLNYLSVNNLWRKFGEIYMWTSSTDPDNCTIKNLIDGFYVFNPHSFPVKIEYLTFVK